MLGMTIRLYPMDHTSIRNVKQNKLKAVFINIPHVNSYTLPFSMQLFQASGFTETHGAIEWHFSI